MNAEENENEAEAGFDPWSDSHLDDVNEEELQRLLDDPFPLPSNDDSTRLRCNEQHEGFDINAGDSWIYPSNLPCRAYQQSITQAALYNNTLVVLPTGLGKTFIAAVVMYNFYRWYPTGKIIFMAPTRPLVAQQIEACQKIMPFPDRDTVELTGKLQQNRRLTLWREKRMFFATPQVVQSDIVSHLRDDSYFPVAQVKLLVFDEAHKARGRYAYTEVAQALYTKNRYFRVLALSATPGRSVDDVALVARNLFISHIEVRSDSSIDVLPYIHKRSIQTIVVPLSQEIKQLQDELEEIIDPYMRQLIDANVIRGSCQSISKNFLLFEQKRFRESCMHQRHPDQVAVNSNFSICISLFHALEMLDRHGLWAFLRCFEDDEDGRQKFVVKVNPQLQSLLEKLRQRVGANPFDISTHAMTNGQAPQMPENLDFGHPKFEETRKCLLDHFKKNPESRAIIFCEYRDSVMLIHRLLLQHGELLKPRCFVGQGGTCGALRAVTQKEQIQIMSDFRSGKSNILVATSIGEEGIDVGEVDLIVCFDISTTNPTRFVQRIGRTGRRRAGQVVMLVTEGREQQLLREVLSAKDQVNGKLLTSPIVKKALYQHAPRLVPTEFNPKCVQTFIAPPEKEAPKPAGKRTKEPAQTKRTSNRLGKAKGKSKAIESTQDLRNFFKGTQTQAVALSPADRNLLDARSMATQNLEPITQNSAEKSLNKVKQHFRSFNLEADSEDLDSSAAEAATIVSSPKASSCDRIQEIQTVQRPKIDASHFRKINKIFRSRAPLLTKAQQSADFLTQLKTVDFSREGKLELLASKAEFVREICDKMAVLEAVEVDPSDSMSQEEKEIRDTYAQFMQLFSGRAELLTFLEDHQRKTSASKAKQISLEDEEDESRFRAALDRVFEGLGPPELCCDNFDFKQEQLHKTRAYKDWLEHHKNKSEALPANSAVYATLNDSDNLTLRTQRFDDSQSHALSGAKSSGSKAGQDVGEKRLKGPATPMGLLQNALRKAEESRRTRALLPVCEEINLISDEEAEPEVVGEDSAPNTVEQSASSQPIGETSAKPQNPCCISSEKPTGSAEGRSRPLSSNGGNLGTPDPKPNSLASRPTAALTPKSIYSLFSTSTPKQSSKPTTETLKAESPLLGFQRASKDLKSSTPISQKPKINSPLSSNNENKAKLLERELQDIDFGAFDEPFSEEETLLERAGATSCSSLKENLLKTKDERVRRASSDLFALMDCKPLNTSIDFNRPQVSNGRSSFFATKNKSVETSEHSKEKNAPKTPDLSSPLQAQARLLMSRKENRTATPSPTQLASANTNASISLHKAAVESPKNSPSTSTQPVEKSPSIFDMCMRRSQQVKRSQLCSRPLTASATVTSPLMPVRTSPTSTRLRPCGEQQPKQPHNAAAAASSPMQATADEESVIFRRPPKRRLIISDSEDDDDDGGDGDGANDEHHNENNQDEDQTTDCEVIAASHSDDSDFESIPATQNLNRGSYRRKRKRRRANAFIDMEAAVSGEEDDCEESELDEDSYLLNSLQSFVQDKSDLAEANHPDAPTHTQMHAVYLKSVKSPQRRPGAFKIPQKRVFNDHTHIFSQPPQTQPSHYQFDSFVVNEEEDLAAEAAESTLCPLERAERILKQRRRAKRRKFAEIAVVSRAKANAKKMRLSNASSSETDSDFDQ